MHSVNEEERNSKTATHYLDGNDDWCKSIILKVHSTHDPYHGFTQLNRFQILTTKDCLIEDFPWKFFQN